MMTLQKFHGDDKCGFFDCDAQVVACALLGKVIWHRVGKQWLGARIIETESYYLAEKGSHASLGDSPSRRALFQPAGTIYMYYARGGDSLNFSVKGAGNAVLVKSGYPVVAHPGGAAALVKMQALNLDAKGQPRAPEKLCAGQTLLCKSLGLKVPDFNGATLDRRCLWLEDIDDAPTCIIQTTRLGIPRGRDEHLPYRFVDARYARYCTRNPLRLGQVEGRDYVLIAC